MDKLFLRELRVETIIGFWEWERRIKQTVVVDLEIGTDARPAAAADRVSSALNYEPIANRLVEFIGGADFHLVESLADAIARIVVADFGAKWVKVSVAKPGAIPAAREVGVIIERTTADYA